ncbi:MAG: hypothetical protein KME64_11550 [Scytonematopsis contorta HA4267-MV1]|jgi:hypothetical protein|nr:hypothetical protein [Scytonematopsis contorta HA4267-MV1]
MLRATKVVKTPTVERLLQQWAKRYTTDFSALSSQKDALDYDSLVEIESAKGRKVTVTKLNNLINISCQMAGIQAQSLYTTEDNLLDLSEARQVTQFSFRVYRKLLSIYQNNFFNAYVLQKETFQGRFAIELGLPAIEELACELEPILIAFQEQLMASKDWASLGFITTQINFTNRCIFNKLSREEKILLAPYLRFVEEYVAVPWQRVCAAAAKHNVNSSAFVLVEKMIPIADEIGVRVYHKLVEMFPEHHSRSGGLIEASVRHSCLRDLNMFQAYLWLCVLEGSLAPIEEELIPLCVMVLENVGIKWDVTQKWSEVLAEEIMSHLQPEQQIFLDFYTHGLQQAFFKERGRLGCAERVEVAA